MPDIDAEQWKPVVGFEELYEVSNLGTIRAIATRIKKRLTPRTLKMQTSKKGYRTVRLCCNYRKTSFLVHRIVLHAFVGPPPKGCETGHYDGNRTNNKLSNLRWITSSENEADKQRHGRMQYGERNHQAKLTAAKVLTIRLLCGRGETATKLARCFGVARMSICRVISRETWKHV